MVAWDIQPGYQFIARGTGRHKWVVREVRGNRAKVERLTGKKIVHWVDRGRLLDMIIDAKGVK